MHDECARRLDSPFCPLCRRLATVVTPILSPGCTNAQKEAGREALQRQLARGGDAGLERSLNQIGQWLELNPDNRIPDGFRKVIESIIVSSTKFPGASGFPLIHFASELSSAMSGDDFERLIRSVWPRGDSPLKSAAILWNIWAEWSGAALPLRPLADIPAIPSDLFLFRLPTRFSDLFTNDFYGHELTVRSRGRSCEFLCCLKCGALVAVDAPAAVVVIAHGEDCGSILFMVITGAPCSALLTFDLSEGEVHGIPALYLTEAGDESLGLVLELPLVLSESRRRTLIGEILTGRYCL
jgi:hypothetical protein